MTYLCSINNTFGERKKRFNITPHFPPEFNENIPVTNVSVVEGEGVVLSCELQANPKANVTWTKVILIIFNQNSMNFFDFPQDSKPLLKETVHLREVDRQLEIKNAQFLHNGRIQSSLN